MRRSFGLLLCAIMMLLAGLSLAGQSKDPLQGATNLAFSDPALEVSRTTPEHTSIVLNSPAIIRQDTVVDYQTYQSFGISGETYQLDEGSPTIPAVTRFYRIPNTGGVDLNIVDAQYDIVDNVNPLPLQGDAQGFSGLKRNESVYTRDDWYPSNVATISAPMIMRDFRVVTVTLYPVQVNPVTHQARVYNNLSVNVVANNQPGENELTNPRRPSGSWVSTYRSMIPNLDDNSLDDATTSPGSILILTSNSSQMLPWADSLAEWKTRKGFKTVIDSRATWQFSQAVQEVHNAYNTWDPPLEYVVLMGDPGWSGVGMPIEGGSYTFDHGYANMTAGDDIEDIGVGRLSGGSAAAMATIWAKITAYEREPHMQTTAGAADTMWFHKSFLYAGTARSMAGNYLIMRWAKDQFIHNTGVYIDSVAVHTGDAVDPTLVRNMINSGLSYMLWRGSWIGGMGLDIADPTTPGGRFPVTMCVTCDAGDFSGSGINSPAEDLLCAGTSTSPRGGVCGMGMSTSTTENGPNCVVAAGLIYQMADVQVEHLGNATAGARAELFRAYGPTHPDGEDPSVHIAWKFTNLFNLLGDPSLALWTDVPESLDVVHPTTLSVGASSMSVTVTRHADGVPVSDAVVCLWKKGPDSTWVRTVTDDQGHATMPISINTTGNLFLTVTKRNIRPYLYTIPCGQADVMPTVSSYMLDDDNTGGTQGNGDGEMNPGETIDLRTYIRNFGNVSSATGVTASLSATDPRVTIINGTATYANLAPGDSALGSVPFRIHVSSGLQNGVQLLLPVTVTSSAGPTSGAIALTCQAGEAHYERQSTSGAFNPGATTQLSVVLRNNGSLAMTGVTGHLVPLTPFVQADVSDATFGDVAAGALDSNTSSPFTISSNSMTFRGLQAPMRLILNTASGFADTVQFIVSVGTARGSDPTGPDAYGYYAYDNTDTSYEMHPTYAYVDIASNGGTNLSLNDPGDKVNWSDDYSVARPLPFHFKFYGRVYDTLTICSNGWCAFGNQAYLDMYRNDQIPSMGAPNAMIAPYWDDLATTGGGHGVWVMNDAANHRYIVQWKAGVGVGYSTQLDFEVMLYDTAFTPTLDGNGIIETQYNVIAVNAPNQINREPTGSTIGIQAPGSMLGLGYLFRDIYSPGAATLVHGAAIRFTTEARMLFGQIQGQILNAANNQPMSGVDVSIDGYNYHGVSNASGAYSIPNVLIGTYSIRAHTPRFNDNSVSNIVIRLDSTVTVDFSMLHPEFAMSSDSIHVIVPENPAQTTFQINNAGNGPLDFSVSVAYAPAGPLDDPWDRLAQVDLTSLTGDQTIQGCEWVHDHWVIAGGSGAGGQNTLYFVDYDGNLAGSAPQPGSSALGWLDMAYDDTLLWGSDSHVITGVNPNSGESVRTIDSPLNPTRAIAYDPDHDAFWVADYTSSIYEVNKQGQIVIEVPNEGANQLAITGLAWHPTDADGYKLYIFSANGTTSQTQVSRMNPATHQILSVATIGQPGERAAGCTITPGWNSTLLVFGGILQGQGDDKLGIYEITFNTTWISISPSAGSVNGASSSPVGISFLTDLLRPGRSYRVNMSVHSSIADTTRIIPVTLTVDALSADRPDNNIPTDYALHQNYPNPFNPTTTIQYDLKNAGRTKLTVYNLMGQQVARLVDAQQPAGVYHIQFDGDHFGSGVYFYRLESGEFTKVSKMVLMK